MKTTKNNSQKIKKITVIGLFIALAYAVSAIIPIKVSFLTLDFKDVISTICGLFFGPLAGVICAAIVPFVEMITTSSTGFYGLVMNLISSITFVGIASIIYKYKKTIYGAILGLVTASVATMGVMTLANILITPYYLEIAMGMPLPTAKDTVKTLLPTTIIPFNVVKSILNASLSMLLYKPLSRVLKSMGVSHSFNGKKTSLSNAQTSVSNKTRSLIVAVVSAAIVVIAFIIVFAVLGGKIA
jgi:ECF transporter S component (folate family)